MRSLAICCAWAMMVFASAEADADDTRTSSAAIEFRRDVEPIFVRRCYACHGPTKQTSNFRLDRKQSALRGGESNQPAIVVGHAIKSPLYRYVAGLEPDSVMPPKGERVSAAELATLKRWIDDGAAWPESASTAKSPIAHWSFQPVARPKLPVVRSANWPRNDIDCFILAKLESAGLGPAPEADRTTWLRRVSFDLIGLPPTPDRIAAFVADRRPDAYQRVVDELLASPRYGERWAQHWLDVVRFADTHGFEVNTERPNAWPYRDYVIDALNRDVPYDRFVREQLVGDALNADAATGFLVTASVLLPGQIGADEPSKRLARQDSLDEIVANIGQTFLGLSIGCARCHDHKFDPISQRDYYAMQAFVAGVEFEDRPVHTPASKSLQSQLPTLKARRADIERQLALLEPRANGGFVRPAVSPRLNRERIEATTTRRVRIVIKQTTNLEPCLDEIEVFDVSGANVAAAATGAVATASGQTLVANRHELRFVNDGLYGNSHSWLGNESGRGWVQIEFPNERTIDRIAWGRDRNGEYADRLANDYVIEVADPAGHWRAVASSADRRPAKGKPARAGLKEPDHSAAKQGDRLAKEWESLGRQMATAEKGQMIFAGRFRQPDAIHLLHRGDPEQPKDLIAPATPISLGSFALNVKSGDVERRRGLADWLASPANPMTARVAVNRVWQGHFGTGLVETASDFGYAGARPSHPELLDWLADRFVANGWSIKKLHADIVLSATYRQSSQPDSRGLAADADNRMLWRFPARRLDAETIRDSMLAVSGRLNLAMGGPGFDTFDKRGGLSGFVPVESYAAAGRRRMIYAHRVRRERDAVFGALDCPDYGQSTARRRESTTPIQALNLINGPFTIAEAAAFADRVEREAPASMESKIQRAFLLALGRAPTSQEIAESLPIAKNHGLRAIGRVLFNLNEFLQLP